MIRTESVLVKSIQAARRRWGWQMGVALAQTGIQQRACQGARRSDCSFTTGLQPGLGQIISLSVDFNLNKESNRSRF